MYPCSRLTFWTLTVSGASFLLSALVASFWFSFLLGAVLLAAGILFRRP